LLTVRQASVGPFASFDACKDDQLNKYLSE
jgi:hypothetical protein